MSTLPLAIGYFFPPAEPGVVFDGQNEKWLPEKGSHFPYLPDHTGAQESWSTPLRYSLGDTPITSRKARANLLALS